ncbi:mucin-2 [Tribolium castaneum]|uniref:mucin-2 n=1 Tax=Tribolium castaneum TaxID=7070 RepID=UPI0030FE6FD4
MPRESSKCREWEKERRNRLNEAFATLCKLLPCYDPATNVSKIDILRNAASYIEELQTKVKTLVSQDNDEPAKKIKGEELKKLQERIRKLLSKNEQLCALLREAKITIPPGCSLRKFKPPFNWCNKIMPEQAKILQKKELDKENNASAKKLQGRKFTNKSRNKNSTPKHRKAILNRSDSKKLRPSKKKKIKPIPTSKCVIVLSQPNATQPCYIITNAPSNNILGGSSTVITNSTLVANPLVSSKAAKTVASMPPLGPGTLILANGTIMPVLPQQTVLPLAPQIITRPPPIILLPRNPVTTSTPTTTAKTITTTTSVKTLTRIKPKYCLTRTTQVNKVPIPALTSRYSNPEVVLKKNEPKAKAKPVEKKVTKEGEKKSEGEKRKEATPDDNCTEAKKAKPSEDKENEKEVSEKVAETVEVQAKCVEEKEKEAEEKPENEPKTTSEPEQKKPDETLELNINSELSNDIFASLQVPAGCQNPESTSPTAAFLLAFPLVSSLTGVKVTEVTEEDNTESQRGTPTLLQIGTMDTTKPTQSESLTPSLLNLDNLSFFSSKDIGGFYSSFEATATTVAVSTVTTVTPSVSKEEKQKQVKNQPVPYYDNHNLAPIPTFCSTNSTNSVSQMSYQAKPAEAKCSNYNTQKMFCNSFDTPKVTTTCSYANQIKSYPEPLYTNSSTYTYSNTSDSGFNQNYYKELPKTDNRSYYSLNYENYTDYRKNDSNTYFPTSNYYTNGQKFATNNNTNNAQKPKNVPQTSRAPINWMTTPDNRDYVLPQFTTKESDFGHNSIYTIQSCNTFTNPQTTYFNTNPMYPSNTNDVGNNPQETRKSLDLPIYQEENQFSWSPSKIPQFLDPPHSFVSSTLPTLVGDLALGNPLTFGEQKTDKCQKKRVKYEGNQNFLSVSQLVDHNKEAPARTTARRNSGNRGTSGKKVPQKTAQRKENKVETGKGMKQLGYSSDLFCETKNRNVAKNSYSAEALIGPQMQADGGHKNRNYAGNKAISVSSFLHDNIIPYFPTVDLPQDNTYMQQNQNYQTSSFSHSSYTSNSFIPSTTTYNFMHDVHDYSENLALFPPVTKDKSCKIVNRNVREQQCAVAPKKSKRKHSNETNLPGFVDFPFLSMPGSINSPILPDDFHTHSGFLQPPTPQLYPCKNPFTKSNDLGSGALLPLPPVPVTRSNIQHPEISPSINSAGTSLTNFNLCTIFPEMNNKSSLPDPYSVKDQTRSYSSSVQVTFNDKPTFSFSYINCTTSQTYNNQ